MLMDWTRGRNIVFSSAAPSVNELRGPCDVSNLLSLLGLSKERAKEAISKNCRYGNLLMFLVLLDQCLRYLEYISELVCRILLANSLRKKRFYKEAIRVEALSSNASQSKEAWHQELLNWDPISSGEGDILLDDLTKSLSDSSEAPKTAKAIDFDSIPSHGFQVKDFLPASNAFPVIPDNKVNFLPVAEKVNQSTNVLNNSTELPNRLDFCPKPDESSLSDAIATQQVVSRDNFCEKNILSGTNEALNFKEEIDTPTNATKLELNNFINSDVDCTLFAAKEHHSKSDLCISSKALDTVIPYENEKDMSSEDAKLDNAHNIDHKVEIFTPSMDVTFPALVHDKHDKEKSSDVNLNAQMAKMHETLLKEDLNIAEHTVLEINTSISENLMEAEQFDKCETHEVELDQMTQQTPDEMKMEDESTLAMHLLPDVMQEDKKLGEVNTVSEQIVTVQSTSGTPSDDYYLSLVIASYMLFLALSLSNSFSLTSINPFHHR